MLRYACTPHRSYRFSGNLDLSWTLGPWMNGPQDPTTRIRGQEAVRAMRTPEGPATLHLRVEGQRILAKAWGAGAEWALEEVPGLLALDEDPVSFPEAPSVVRALHHRARGLRFGRTRRVFELLVPLVLHQLVQWREAAQAFRNLVYATSELAPGPVDLLLPPAPERIARLGEESFTSWGILRKQARTLRELAWAAPRLERLASVPLDEVERKLCSVEGIGPWTSGMALLIGFGHTDAVPLGDFHLPHTVAFHLAGEVRATDERMLELLEPYRGQRGRIVRLFKFGAKAAPRFGPRRPLRAIPKRGG